MGRMDYCFFSDPHRLRFAVLLAICLNSVVIGNEECKRYPDKSGCSSEGSRPKQFPHDEEYGDLIESVPCLTENDTTNSIASCADRGSHRPAAFINLRNIPCFCDALCNVYQDCCVDKVQESYVSDTDQWACRDITQIVIPTTIYVMQRCLPGYTSQHVRSLCENEAVDLNDVGEYFNYLQGVPVHSTRTGIMYRNVYCAMCNDDTELTKWRTHIHCVGDAKKSADLDAEGRFPDDAVYDPRNNEWHIHSAKGRATCKLIIEELASWGAMRRYGARLCIPSVSTCPSNADPTISRRCRAYTSYVYHADDDTVYKNFHCGLCNNVSAEKLFCIERSYHKLLFGIHIHTGKVWLPVLFDFNFEDSSDNKVGISRACRLKDGQIWDPLLKSCLNVTCGRLFKEENGKCLPISQKENVSDSVLQVDCRKVILAKEHFTVTDNGSIYVNYSEMTYSRGQYEVFEEEEDGVLKAILVCEHDKLLFEFDSAQVWLSELTLSLSVICLLLHLITYGILPELRNRPGKILMSLSSNLVCAHLFFLLEPHFRGTEWLCYVNSVLTYFGYVSSFLWMNVMAMDIHRTFSRSRTRSSGNKVFVMYSLYAWICPILLVTITCTTDFVFPESAFSPKFGRGICWFNHKRGLLVFFAVPLAAILLANLILFSITALNIRKVSKQTKLVNKFSEKMRFFLYIKLAIVLGLTWLCGFLAAFSKIHALWYPFIVFNGLQGALIFLVFTVKRKIIHMLIVKLKLRSDKYSFGKAKLTRKGFYSSLSTLTTLQTTVTSGVVPAACGSPDMLRAVRKLNVYDTSTKL